MKAAKATREKAAGMLAGIDWGSVENTPRNLRQRRYLARKRARGWRMRGVMMDPWTELVLLNLMEHLQVNASAAVRHAINAVGGRMFEEKALRDVLHPTPSAAGASELDQ